MPKVSIGMPVYNKAKFLKQAIESILKQTFQDFELIIFDDCSVDNSIEIANSFNDERITIYKNSRNMGQAETLNNCIDKASGEYITFAHGDDYWHEKFLETHVKHLDNNPKAILTHSLEHIVDENNNFISKNTAKDIKAYEVQPAENILKSLMKGCCVNTPAVMLRRGEFPYFNNQFPIVLDWDLWLRIAIKSIESKKNFILINYPLIYYRNSSDNVTANATSSGEDVLDSYMMLNKLFKDFRDKKEIIKYKNLAFYRLSLRALRLARKYKTRTGVLNYLKLCIFCYPLNIFYPVVWYYFFTALVLKKAGLKNG